MSTKDYFAIVAMDDAMGIGKDGGIPWDNSEDLKKFYKITTKSKEGKTNMVVMGRKTWEKHPGRQETLKETHQCCSIEKLSRRNQQIADDTFGISDSSLVDELVQNLDIDKVFIIGGAEIYRLFSNRIGYSYITRVKGDFACDTFWPDELRTELEDYHDIPYLSLLEKVLYHGENRTDRTGTGTISLFAP